MKRILYVFIVLILSLLICFTGCSFDSSNDEVIKKINGVLFVSAKDASNLVGLNCEAKDANIIFRQDGISLNINFTKPYIYKDDYIMGILEKPAVDIGGRAFVPASFFTDFLKVLLNTDDVNELSVKNKSSFHLYNIVKFLPKDVFGAITDKKYPYREKILKAVELPRSMGINIPNINMEKVFDIDPLNTFKNEYQTNLKKLKRHGFAEKEVSKITLGEYEVIQNSWKLSKELIASLKTYTELKYKDLSNWTYGDYENFYKHFDELTFERGYTLEQKKQLSKRGILLEDVHYLLKDFYKIDTILNQSDKVLKESLIGYYQFKIDYLK